MWNFSLGKVQREVNYKGHNGDTHLHFYVESGDIDIVKLLVYFGVKNNQINVKSTPAIQVCCYGCKNVMKFINSMFPIKFKKLYDNYCLFSANAIRGSKFS